MILVLGNVVAIAAVGWLVLRRGRDRRADGVRSARWLRVAGLIPLGMQVAFFLLFGLGEMAGGEPSGAGHLVQAAVVALLGLLAWLRPLEGGAALLSIAGLLTVSFVANAAALPPADEPTAASAGLLILAVPQLISGALFLVAGWLAQRQ